MALPFLFLSCSSDDDATNLNQYESALVGTWNRVTPVAAGAPEQTIILKGDLTGTMSYSGSNIPSQPQAFTWSATATTITIKVANMEVLPIDYKLKDGKIEAYGFVFTKK